MAAREGYSSPGLFLAETVERTYGKPREGEEECDHPEDRQRLIVGAVFCGRCGRRLR